MSLQEWCAWLENSRVGLAVAESGWLFPTLETVHVLAITLVVGSIAMIDLRLLGLSSRHIAVSRLSEDTLPFTWIAFALAVASGALLFTSNATHYYDNWPFRAKLCLIAVAGLNMLLFQKFVFKDVRQWDLGQPAPGVARLAGGLSLVLWIGVVTLGRWIAFV